MDFSRGWIILRILTFFAIPLLAAAILLWSGASWLFSTLSGISASNGYMLLAGIVLGLIPGMVLIAYAHFKAMTRYFPDTSKEAAQKAANEALKALEEAKGRTKAAYIEKEVPFQDWMDARRAAREADAWARRDMDAAEARSARQTSDEKKELAKKARAKYHVAKLRYVLAKQAEELALSAYSEAAKTAAEAIRQATKPDATQGVPPKGDIARNLAKAESAKADAALKTATANAAAAKAEAAKMEAAAKAAAAKALKAQGTAKAAAAQQDADLKAEAARQAVATAEKAFEAESKAIKEAADRAGNWRSTLLNPEGMQRSTLERAGKIREDELKGFRFLAILLVIICWVAFAVCWSGWLEFSPAIENSDTALKLSSAGAYIYVLILLGRRNFQRDITPASVLWCCLTMAVGPMLALVLAYVWIGSSFNNLGPLNEKAIFFLAGLAPRHLTAFLLEILRRAMLAATGKPALVTRLMPLQQVRGITREVEERLEEEGIFDVINLAMADPMRLLRNTSFDKFQILTWIDEALLIYTFPQHWQALENEGITGAMDMAWYIVCLHDTESLAVQVKLNPDGLKKIVQRLAEDAQVQLIWILYDLDNPNE